MASLLNIQASDFENGLILLSQNDNTETDIDATIEDVEVDVLQHLFGAELYTLFIADLVDGVPQEQRLIDVYNPFFEQDDCQMLESKGMIIMIKWFVWAKFTPTQRFQNTEVGMMVNESENGSNATPSQYGWALGYNKGVNPYANIQAKMIDDPDLYPEFKGLPKQIASII